MPHKRRTAGVPGIIDVRVMANDVAGAVAFTHTWRDTANPNQWNDPPIRLAKHTGPWTLNYYLHDFTGLGLEFRASADDSMWVRQGSNCPGKKGNGGHMDFISVGAGPTGKRTRMTVEDDNAGSACSMRYLLCFDPDPAQYRYDPDIKNGGTS